MTLYRKMVVGSHWKIYIRSLTEARDYIQKMKRNLKIYDADIMEAYILPDFGNLTVVSQDLKGFQVSVGAQDVFWEDYGPYTGEISPLLLVDVGCKFVMLGHSERRIYFGESNETVNKKVLACYRNGLIPLLLIGETSKERNAGKTQEVLKEQLGVCLNEVPEEFMSSLVLIYEPRWAIGKRDSASLNIIKECHQIIRNHLANLYSDKTAKIARILYGGSVNTENAEQILSILDVDGLAVTRASLDPVRFVSFIQMVEMEANRRVG